MSDAAAERQKGQRLAVVLLSETFAELDALRRHRRCSASAVVAQAIAREYRAMLEEEARHQAAVAGLKR